MLEAPIRNGHSADSERCSEHRSEAGRSPRLRRFISMLEASIQDGHGVDLKRRPEHRSKAGGCPPGRFMSMIDAPKQNGPSATSQAA